MPSLYLGTEIGSAGRTLNRPLHALLEFDWRVWMDQLTLYMTSGKVMLDKEGSALTDAISATIKSSSSYVQSIQLLVSRESAGNSSY